MKIIITEEQFNSLMENDVNLLTELKFVNTAQSIDGTPFVLYNGTFYMFNSQDSNIFIQEITNFIYDSNLSVPMPDDYGECWEFIEHDLGPNPNYISGYFTAKNNITAIHFYKKYDLDVSLSDEVKKIFNELKGINEFYFNDEIVGYTREELMNNFGKLYNTEVKLPNYLYHGTSNSYVNSILKQGIAPQKGFSNFPGVATHTKHVFLSSSYETARNYSDVAIHKKSLDAKGAVLKIDSSKIDKNKITFDFDFYHRYVGKGNEHFDNIRKPVERNDYAMGNKSNQIPGAKFNKLGYNGTIYPGAIVSIYVEESFNRFVEMTPQEYLQKYNQQ